MIALRARNVEEALPEGCRVFDWRKGTERESRAGRVRVLRGLYATEYSTPTERVLFDPDRDANPYFHFMEALWMLGGRADVAFPKQFNSKFGQFSDDGKEFHGAYGRRWRSWFGADQLRSIVAALLENRECRRQVLGIWDPTRDLGADSKDVPCNLSVVFQVAPDGRSLDATVFNRSNDLIWGAYGANAVQFSFLLEYLAVSTGLTVGRLTQVSANTHVYERHWDLVEKLAKKSKDALDASVARGWYSRGLVAPYPLVNVSSVGAWDRELATFLDRGVDGTYRDPFFREVACRLLMSWMAFSNRKSLKRFDEAIGALQECPASDWAKACREWVERRAK